MRNYGLTLVELLVGITILFLLILSISAFFIEFSSKGEGTHVGYITAVDQKGYIFQNYQVFFKTDRQSSQEDVYCINRNSKDLIKVAKDAAHTKRLVTLEYVGVRGIGLGLCHGEEITNIK